MFKNVSGQKVKFFAWDVATNLGKTGDAANIIPYVIKDDGTSAALATATITEIDSTNLKGWYLGSLSQAESNYNDPIYAAKSSTTGISVIGSRVSTVPINFQARVIDTNGVGDANMVGQCGSLFPTGTARSDAANTVSSIALPAGWDHTKIAPNGGDAVILLRGTGALSAGVTSSVTGLGTSTPVAIIADQFSGGVAPGSDTVFMVWPNGGGLIPTDGSTLASASVVGAIQTIVNAIKFSAAGNVKADVEETAGATLPGGLVPATVSALGANTINSTTIASGAITAAKIAVDSIGSDQLASSAIAEIVAGVFSQLVVNGYSVLQILRLLGADAAGLTSGMDTLAPKIRDLANSKNVINATIDATGNRTSVTLDLT